MSQFLPPGLGWIPDLPDLRDCSTTDRRILSVFDALPNGAEDLPASIDLRRGDSGECYVSGMPARNGIRCSTASVVLQLVEYLERRSRGRTCSGSVRFLYKTSRMMAGIEGDSGASLRTTLKALTKFGIVDETYWPHDAEQFDQEPSAFVFGVAESIPEFSYLRLPTSGGSWQPQDVWRTLQRFLAAGFPVVFGFSVPSSITREPEIPYRPGLDAVCGGIAALALGYDANRFGADRPGLLIGTNWGDHWGDNGFGWLPASYVRDGMARDFWTIVYHHEMDPTEFCNPIVDEGSPASIRSESVPTAFRSERATGHRD